MALQYHPAMYANVAGPFVNASGKMETLLDVQGIDDIHVASQVKARPAPLSTNTRVVDVETYPGVDADVVVSLLLWRVAKDCAGDRTASPRVALGPEVRLRMLLSCLHACFPTEFNRDLPAFGGLSINLVPLAGQPLTDMIDANGGGGITWTAAPGAPYGITSADQGESSLELCRVMLGVYLWGMIRQIVPNRSDAHVAKRKEAIKGIIGGDYPVDSLAGNNWYPTETDWVSMSRMADSNYHLKGIIMRAACMMAYRTQSAVTAGFSAHIRLLEGYGLGNFRAIMRMQVDAGAVLVKNKVLSAGSREFFVNCYKPWKNLSEFDQMYKKVIEGPEYVPMAKLSNRLIAPAAMLYMKVSTEGMDGLMIRGLRDSMVLWLTSEFKDLKIEA